MPFLDFDAARREAVNEPVAFQLRGERFECLAKAPAGAMFALASRGLTGLACRDFLVAIIDDADIERFGKVLANRDDPVDLADLADLTERLVEAYAGRPTQPSTDLSAGRSTTGRTSKAASAKKRSSR